MSMMVEAGRRERKRQAVHDTVLDVASELFREKGVAATTVDDIAGAADVARQTVFNHFPYKEAMAVELGAKGIHKVAERTHAYLESGASAFDVLVKAAEWMFQAALDDREIGVVVAQELLHPDPCRAGRATEQVPLAAVFEAILTEARHEGQLREDLPVDTVAKLAAMGLTGVVAQLNTRPPAELERELSICFDIVLNGIIKRS